MLPNIHLANFDSFGISRLSGLANANPLDGGFLANVAMVWWCFAGFETCCAMGEDVYKRQVCHSGAWAAVRDAGRLEFCDFNGVGGQRRGAGVFVLPAYPACGAGGNPALWRYGCLLYTSGYRRVKAFRRDFAGTKPLPLRISICESLSEGFCWRKTLGISNPLFTELKFRAGSYFLVEKRVAFTLPFYPIWASTLLCLGIRGLVPQPDLTR